MVRWPASVPPWLIAANFTQSAERAPFEISAHQFPTNREPASAPPIVSGTIEHGNAATS
jgi:hypothetical protein